MISRTLAPQLLSLSQKFPVVTLTGPRQIERDVRLIKTPKLYFYDTGLACSLLGIRSIQQ